MKNRNTLYVLLIAGLLSFAGMSYASVETHAVAQTNDTPEGDSLHLELLYVQVGPHATLTKSCDDAGKNCHGTLQLLGAEPYMLTFSNGAPNIGGYILNSKFVEQYNKLTDQTGLNTALISMYHGKPVQQVVTLYNPTYDAEKKEMDYEVTYIKSAKNIKATNKLHDVALFIDGICAICVGP